MIRKIFRTVCPVLLCCTLIAATSCDKKPKYDEALFEPGYVVDSPLKAAGVSDIWWQNWPAWTHNDSVTSVLTIQADAVTCMPGFRDEGIGRFARERSLAGSEMRDAASKGQIRGTAWLESFGETRVYAMGLKQNSDGSFEQDDEIEGPRIYSDFWNWSRTGPGMPGSEVNYVAWAGVDAYVNGLPWLGGMSAAADGLPEPTYPDGTSALGYIDDAVGDPLKAKIYDANCAKDISGRFDRPEQLMDTLPSQGSNKEGFLAVTVRDGSVRYFGDLNFGKDVASPWWIHYARSAVKSLLEAGVSGFWIDNYEGWDTWSRQSIARAFGDWSEYLFREYLAENPGICAEAGITDTASFEVTEYLKEKFLEFSPGGDPDSIYSSGWNDIRWMDEPVWRAYKVYKSELLTEKLSELRAMIKEEARALGLDPDDIVVTGNAGPFSMPDHMNEQVFDIASVEHSSILTDNPLGLAPNGGGGPIFSLLNHIQQAPGQSVIWYYANSSDNRYIDKTTIGTIAAYECLAHNVILNAGENDNMQIGTARSAMSVNRTLKAVRDFYGTRSQRSQIGVVYSMASEFSQAMPGGYPQRMNLASTVGYMGWGLAFQHMNVPYTGIMEYTLRDKIDDLRVLVLPGMRAISRVTIDEVLLPWLDKGNTLVVTGSDAGYCDDRTGLYAPHDKPLLKDLADTYSGAGRIVYFEKDPGQAYFAYHLISDDLETDRQSVSDLYNELIEDGRLAEELRLEGFGRVLTTVNENKDGGRVFIDLVNYDYSDETDSYNNMQSGKVRYLLPDEFVGKKIRVSGFDEISRKFVVMEFVLGDDGSIEVDVPSFESYSAIMIEGD